MLAAALHGALGASPVTYDVVVVGAGPAGAVAAREAARRGASVLLIDRSDFPRRKVCGGCLSAGALEALEAAGLGTLAETLGAQLLGSMVLSAGRRSARLALEPGRALSRTALDAALVVAARDVGVRFLGGVRAVPGPLGSDHRVVSVERSGRTTPVRARVVLDATGLGGFAAPARPSREVARGSRIGLGALFDDPRYPVGPGALHMVIGRAGYVGLVRVESGLLNVAAAVDPAALKDSTPSQVIADILTSGGAEPLTRSPLADWRGTPTLTRRPADVAAERLLRLGDAAGYVEPFTGEGMCWALSAALASAPLAVEGALGWTPSLADRWRRYDADALRRARRLCRLLAAALRRPRLVETGLAALRLAPSVARPIVRRVARAPEPTAAYSA